MSEFKRHLLTAFQNKSNVSFETNFNNPKTLNHVVEAKKSGLRTELIYIGLKNSELAIERVHHRIQNGGHPVDDDTIRKRYNDGLKLLDTNYKRFDEVRIYESPPNFAPIIKCLGVANNRFNVDRIPSFMDKLPSIRRILQQSRDQGMSF